MSKRLLPMFQVYGFRSYIQVFNLFQFFYMVQFNFICTQLSSFSNTIYGEDYLFLTVYSCFLCHRLINHIILDLSSLFSAIDLLCLFLCQHHTVLIIITLQYRLKSGFEIPPALFVFSQDPFDHLMSFVAPYKFQGFLFNFYKKYYWYLS